MIALSKPARLFHAPFTCSFAVRLAAAWGNVELDILPVRLGVVGTELEAAHQKANVLQQVSTLILPDDTTLTETSACLVWIQSQSNNSTFKRQPETPDYYQMLRWIGFCATELHKQLLRIIFYDEATDPVKDEFRELAASRLEWVNSHLTDRQVLVGATPSAADAYLLWFLTLCEKGGVSLSPYAALTDYFKTHQDDPHFVILRKDDAVMKQSLNNNV